MLPVLVLNFGDVSAPQYCTGTFYGAEENRDTQQGIVPFSLLSSASLFSFFVFLLCFPSLFSFFVSLLCFPSFPPCIRPPRFDESLHDLLLYLNSCPMLFKFSVFS